MRGCLKKSEFSLMISTLERLGSSFLVFVWGVATAVVVCGWGRAT